MPDEFHIIRARDSVKNISWQYPPLPPWLARRLLAPDEEVTWVRGPQFTPSWERYLTHLGFFPLALAVAVGLLAVGRSLTGSWSAIPVPLGMAALVIVFGSIYVLAAANAYFTRLVVTNRRMVILQGHELCRDWSINALPLSLRRYRILPGGGENWSVDVGALQAMLGGPADGFADAKALRAFGKQLDQIRASEEGRS